MPRVLEIKSMLFVFVYGYLVERHFYLTLLFFMFLAYARLQEFVKALVDKFFVKILLKC